MVRRDEVLAPVFDPLHRAAEVLRRERDDELFARREELLAEAATDVARGHAHEVLGNAGDARDRGARLVRVLRRHPGVELAARRVVVGDDAARLHRHVGLAVLIEGLGDDVRGLGDDRLPRRVERERHLLRDVRALLGVHEVLGVGRRGLEVDDGRQRVELELHEVARVLGDVAVLGDHEHDRVADEAHVGVGERAQRRVRRIVEQDRRLHRPGVAR